MGDLRSEKMNIHSKKIFHLISKLSHLITMNWNTIQSATDLAEIKRKSHENPVVIFKHSTRCSISSMALDRLQRSWNEAEMEGVVPYFLDLIAHRGLSDQIAQEFGVDHESPQVLVIDREKCVYDTSHMGINYRELQQFAKANHS